MNKKMWKQWEQEMVYWSKVMIGGTILVYSYLPKKCYEAYQEYKESKQEVKSNEK